MTNFTFNRKNRSLIVAAIIGSCIFLAGFGVLHDDGIVGRTQKNGAGCTCHNPFPNNSVTVSVSGPDSVYAGSNASFIITLSGGPAISGGFNVASNLGTLGTLNGEAKVLDGELTHTAPKSFGGGETVEWTFSYHAPSVGGTDTLYSVAQSVNGNGIPDNSDQWNFGAKHPVRVIAVHSSLPLLTEWGIVVLAVLLAFTAISLTQRRERLKSSA